MASGFRLIELETLTTDDEILPGGFSSSLDPGDPAPPTRHSSILWPYRLFYLFVCTSGICSTSGPDISSIFRLEFLLEWKSVITFFFFYKLHFIVYDNKIFKYFSYHNVDIYLFPIFLVTNKKKIFEETNSNTKKISNYGIKLRSNLSRDDWCFSPDRYKDISHFANL